MTRPRRTRRQAGVAGRPVPRTARLNELLRQVLAEELERIGDERLEHVTITTVDVDADMNRAIVYFDALAGETADNDAIGALGSLRVRLQSAVGRQVRARKTPILQFRPDDVIRSAERIDRLLRDLPPSSEASPGGDTGPA